MRRGRKRIRERKKRRGREEEIDRELERNIYTIHLRKAQNL